MQTFKTVLQKLKKEDKITVPHRFSFLNYLFQFTLNLMATVQPCGWRLNCT